MNMDPQYKHGVKKRRYSIKLITSVIIVVILIVAAVATLSSSNIHYISSPTTVSILQNSSIYYKLPSSQSTFVLYLKNSTNYGSLFYITSIPILSSPVMALSLNSNSSANVSSSNIGIADMHISLLNSNSKGAVIEITPIPTSLGLKPNGQISIIPQATFTEKMLYKGNVVIVSTTTTSSTTTITTTTINQSAIIPVQQIMTFMNSTSYGILANNLNSLYIKDRVCNASVYNATFIRYENIAPTGPNSFYNVSPSVPRSVNITISRLGSNSYIVTYIGVTPLKSYTSPILIMKLNMSSISPIVNATFEGPFKYMNYTQVASIYALQSSVGTFCGAYVP
jgi:hypothetical protein